MEVGKFVAGKNNTYQVISVSKTENAGLSASKWVNLKCVDFYDVDDLGDGILCTRLDQEIWIANYFFEWMPKLEISPDNHPNLVERAELDEPIHAEDDDVTEWTGSDDDCWIADLVFLSIKKIKDGFKADVSGGPFGGVVGVFPSIDEAKGAALDKAISYCEEMLDLFMKEKDLLAQGRSNHNE